MNWKRAVVGLGRITKHAIGAAALPGLLALPAWAEVGMSPGHFTYPAPGFFAKGLTAESNWDQIMKPRDVYMQFPVLDFGTVASNTGYTIASLWGQPRLGLQADVASGGGPGGTLKTFYPLFPKFAYFTEAAINAPMNFIDVFPSVTVQPWRNFAVKVGIDVLWRYSVQDAFYQPPGLPLVPGSANTKRFLGAQSVLQFEWQATPHISVNAAYVHFLTEGFLKAAGAKDIDFVGLWTAYKF